MKGNELQMKVHVEHNLEEVEATLDRIISKAEKAKDLLQQVGEPRSAQEVFLDAQMTASRRFDGFLKNND